MSTSGIPSAPARHVQQLLDRLAVDPDDLPAFRALEEHFFLAGEWSRLAGVYECRIAAAAPGSQEWIELQVRLARVLEQRLGAADAARRRYEELLERSPRHPEALASLRALLARSGDVTAALQIAEIEEQMLTDPCERALALTQIAELWRDLGDPEEARRRLEQARALDPGSAAALLGLAQLMEASGRTAEAIRLHEQRIERLAGHKRTDAMEHLARLLPEGENDRRRTLLREVVREEPERVSAIELLIDIERAAGDLPRVAQLWRELFDRSRDREQRVRIAVTAAALHLDELGDLEGALGWTDRGLALAPAESRLYQVRARIFRRRGDVEALILALERLEALEGRSAMRLLEIAVLHERRGALERAVEVLQILLEVQPGEPEGLVVLDRCLVRLGRLGARIPVLQFRLASARSNDDAAGLACELGDACAATDDLAAAEAAYRDALRRAPAHERAIEHLGALLAKADRADELGELLSSAADSAPSREMRAERLCALGHLRETRLDDPVGARRAYELALEGWPECERALSGLRTLAARSRDPRLQVKACEHELRQARDSARRDEIFEEMIRVLLEERDVPGARRACERWCAEASEPAAFERAAALARMSADSPGEQRALETLEGLLADRPRERAAVAARLAELVLATADPDAADRAADWLRSSLAAAPDPEVRKRLIELYRREARLPELAQQLEQLIQELAPDASQRPARTEELARVLVELGDAPRAIERLRPAFEAAPGNTLLADLYENLLAEHHRTDALVDALGRRLAVERDPTRRRELAARAAELLLDELGRADDAVAVLHEFADPSRDDRLERLYGRALERSARREEQERWLAMRERHADGEERIEVLMMLAHLQHAAGRVREAIGTLTRAEQAAPGGPSSVARPLFMLVQDAGTPEEKLERLDALLEAESETSSDPRARAAFRLERARLLVEELHRAGDARGELDALAAEGLSADELRVATRLALQAEATGARARLLDRLTAVLEPGPERRSACLTLARLRLGGPEEVRDPRAAERGLAALLEGDPSDGEASALLEDLYGQQGRVRDLAGLLRDRLSGPDLARGERCALALRLADAWLELGDPAGARAAAETARALDARSPALDERLYRALELLGDGDAAVALCEERLRAGETPSGERELWVRRWLDQLAGSERSLEERLTAVRALLEHAPAEIELREAEVNLLRELGSAAEFCESLEKLLASSVGRLSPARRRVITHELLGAVEGALGDPGRALGIAIREARLDRSLLGRASRLAERAGDPRAEADLLLELREELPERGLEPRELRRLGLALVASGRTREALPWLRQALSVHSRDRELIEALSHFSTTPEERRDLLEARFALEPSAALAREASEICAELDDPRQALAWLQRWAAIEPLPWRERERRLELEREVGTASGALQAIEALLETGEPSPDPRTRAERLAERARLRMARGEPAEAVRDLAEACAGVQPAPAPWLELRAELLDALGLKRERAEVLRELSRHPALSLEHRGAHQEARLALMISQPDLRAQAARELRLLVDAEPEGKNTVRRMRALLELYEALGRDVEWCALAERLLGLVDGSQAAALERELARRLDRTLGAHARAAAIFERILEGDPDDAEAFERLLELWRAPGCERRRAALLEARAQRGGPLAERRFGEAAELYWRALGDSRSTLRCVDGALALDSGCLDAHRLRAEVCASTGARAEEQHSLRAVLGAEPRGTGAASRWLRLAQLALDDPEHWLEAQHAAEQALSLCEAPALMRSEVREVYERVGHFEHALRLLRDEVRECAREGRPDHLRRLARIALDELGDSETARESLETLARESELLPEDHDRLATVLEHAGELGRALAERRASLLAQGDHAPASAWLLLSQRWLEELDDRIAALSACDQAIALEPRSRDARALRATLRARLCDVAGEIEDLEALASLEARGAQAAAHLARAARLVERSEGDRVRALGLYRSAAARDGACLAALEGLARLSHEYGASVEAARTAELACTLLEGRGEDRRRGELALLGAEAAVASEARACASRLFELAVRTAALDARSLDRLAELGARLERHDEARCALELRLECEDVAASHRAELLRRLARACESCGDLEAAARALGDALASQPGDEVSHAKRVQLFERLESPERAVHELDAWSPHAPPEHRADLQLHAARLESEAGWLERARERLVALRESGPVPDEAFRDLAELELRLEAPERVLKVAEQALPLTRDEEQRAALLWARARAFAMLGQPTRAVEAVLETLTARPDHLDAARFLARNFGRAPDWRAAVEKLERALDRGEADAALEAELWESVGRAYAGPLEDLVRAQRAYRSALDVNPLREASREALADVTSFDPAAHAESARLHRELLRAHPARAGSWRAIGRMAEHWGREQAGRTARAALHALGVEPDAEAGALCVRTDAGADDAAAGATEILRALEEGGALPASQGGFERIGPPWLTARVEALAGKAWSLGDALVEALVRRTVDERAPQQEELSRRLRRRVQKAASELSEYEGFDAAHWRAALLAQSAAEALRDQQVELAAALETLVHAWPATRDRNLAGVSNPGVLFEDCPPARALLLRIADAAIDGLGLL